MFRVLVHSPPKRHRAVFRTKEKIRQYRQYIDINFTPYQFAHVFTHFSKLSFYNTIEFEHLIVECLKMSKTTVDQYVIHVYKL